MISLLQFVEQNPDLTNNQIIAARNAKRSLSDQEIESGDGAVCDTAQLLFVREQLRRKMLREWADERLRLTLQLIAGSESVPSKADVRAIWAN